MRPGCNAPAQAGDVRGARARLCGRRRPEQGHRVAADGARGRDAPAGRRPGRRALRRLPRERLHRPGPVRRGRGRARRPDRARAADRRSDRPRPAPVDAGAHVRRAGPAEAGRALWPRGALAPGGVRAVRAPRARAPAPGPDPARPAPPHRGRRGADARRGAHARRGRRGAGARDAERRARAIRAPGRRYPGRAGRSAARPGRDRGDRARDRRQRVPRARPGRAGRGRHRRGPVPVPRRRSTCSRARPRPHYRAEAHQVLAVVEERAGNPAAALAALWEGIGAVDRGLL